jgi:small-conductance mechanosensitive channel
MAHRLRYCRTLTLWLAALLLIAGPLLTPASAQDEEAAEVLDAARRQLTTVQKTIPGTEEDDALIEMRSRLTQLQERLERVTAKISPQIAALDARIEELGTAPDAPEQRELTQQRNALTQQRAALDGQAKLAALLLLETEQALADITARRRELFQQRLSERFRSPFGIRFWAAIKNEVRRDASRALSATSELTHTLGQASMRAWLGASVATIVALVARSLLSQVLLKILTARGSRPALRAFTYVALWTVTSVLIARWWVGAAISGAEMSERVEVLLTTLIACAGFGTYIVTLGAAVLGTCAQPWRTDILSQPVMAKLRSFPPWFAAVLVASALAEQFCAAANLSLAATVAIEALMATALGVVMAVYLRRIAPRYLAQWGWGGRSSSSPPRPLWASVVIGFAWLALGAGALCLILGFIALGGFIIKQLAWALIVVCTAVLLARVLANTIHELLAPKDADQAPVATSRMVSARLQAAVLLSALAQILIGFFALLLLLAPYGAGPAELLELVARAQEGLSIGQIRLRPGELVRAILVLVLGVIAVKHAQRWMQERYLPLTRMDSGMRDSVTSLVTYVGYVIVVALALSAIGVNLQQIAWVASALAVGIGFGLQAIVQNFVSGLILLTERPVRIGDWVSLGDIEGDVRRINVRATEILKGDRSTVIVPNAEFITKAVRNVTHNSPLGVVQFKLPLPLAADLERARDELLRAFRHHPDILRDPAPSVMIDGVEGTNVVFKATGYVHSPRAAYAVRSAVLFDALARLREAGVR